LPITTTPPAETAKRRRSSSGSTPTRALSAKRTFLSTIARLTTAWRPTSTPGMRIDSSTSE
jgi:hypothetical protein